MEWDWPPRARFLEGLGTFCRLIRFDKRGTGLSDRPDHVATLEERADDIRAVMDAAGSDSGAILGVSEGSSMACVFAATYPDRTRALLVWGGQARWVPTDDYPWGIPAAEYERQIAELNENGVTAEYVFSGHVPDDPAFVEYMTRWFRAGASPAALAAQETMNMQIDIRDILSMIHVPTLVMNRVGDPVANVEAARDLARHIPGARFCEFPGETHSLQSIEPQKVLATIEEFVTGSVRASATNRALATILFVDIVGSTERAADTGDAAWKDLLARFYALTDGELGSFGGVVVDRAGDGVLATFDGPARAIRCASAVVNRAHDLGLHIRAGIHSGEVERDGAALRGIAVHVGARVAALAAPDEVLVSSIVRDLVAGSGITFKDRGMHTLKGVSEPRQLFAAMRS
jgi:class 3 adenylate cyclase